MSYNVKTISVFERQAKRLIKKIPFAQKGNLFSMGMLSYHIIVLNFFSFNTTIIDAL